ncbi:hypothetical protein [Dongia sp.]|uniref:hypothetical protein n=1 Tax=Dongia sp. TaxID=1977262 RepID=UPI0035B07296
MARLVVPELQRGRLAAQSPEDIPPDKYKDRLIKYVPAESIAFYALTDRFLSSYYGLDPSGATTTRPADNLMFAVSWALLLLGVLGTPFYLWRQRLPGQPWKLHVILSTVAFLFWAYTLGGTIFVLHGVFSVLLAGIVAPVFTFIAGAFEPRHL